MSRRVSVLRARRKEQSVEDLLSELGRILVSEDQRTRERSRYEEPSETRLEIWDTFLERRKSPEIMRTPLATLEDKVEALNRRQDAIEEKADLALAQVRVVSQGLGMTPNVDLLRQTLEALLPRLRHSPNLSAAKVYIIRRGLATRGSGPAGIIVVQDSPRYYESGLAFFGLIDELAREGHDVDEILLFRECEISEERLRTDYEEVS